MNYWIAMILELYLELDNQEQFFHAAGNQVHRGFDI
jgi:hypothetical protein